MNKLTIDTLKELREDKKREFYYLIENDKKTHIIIGMSSCGIAAGAEATLKAFQEEIATNDLDDIEIHKTGCLGLCHSEPTVEVRVFGMPTVIYGNVSDEIARKIINRHVVAKHLVDHHIFDKPSADILK